MKGRKGDASLRQAKTDPARRTRRSRNRKAVEAAEQRALDAQERAKQFATDQAATVMPPFMSDPQYAGAAAIWRFHEPLLRERNFWEPQFIAPFTGFCIYYDEFLAADREVKAKGFGIEGKSTSGGNRFWKNPAVDVRDHAFARVMELSARYAFTPLDLYKLERESAAAGSSGRGRQHTPGQNELLPAEPDDARSEPAHASGPGALTAFDSEPPSQSRN